MTQTLGPPGERVTVRHRVARIEGYREQWDEIPGGDIPLPHARLHPAYCPDCRLTQYSGDTQARARFVGEHQGKGCSPVDPLAEVEGREGDAPVVIDAVDDLWEAALARHGDEELRANDSLGAEDYIVLIIEAVRDHRAHGLRKVRAAIEGGNALAALRRKLRHGDFGPAVQRLGLGERTARRWMQVAASGLSAEEVQERGGIRRALAGLQPPAAGLGPEPDTVSGLPEPVRCTVCARRLPEDGTACLHGLGPAPEPWDGGLSDAHCAPKPDTVSALGGDGGGDMEEMEEMEEGSRFVGGDVDGDGRGLESVQYTPRITRRICYDCQRNVPRRGSPYCRPCERVRYRNVPHIRYQVRLEKTIRGLQGLLDRSWVPSRDGGFRPPVARASIHPSE